MSTPTRYQQWTQPLLAGRLGQAEVQEPDPDPEDPTDYASAAEGGAIQVGLDLGSVAKVQEDAQHTGAAGPSVTCTFGATPEQGNTLIAVLAVRSFTNASMVSSGWTLHPSTYVNSDAGDGGRLYLWYKTASAAESTTVQVDAANAKDLYIAEWSGLGAPDDSDFNTQQSASTSMSTPAITPVASDGVLFAGFLQASRNGDLALGGGYTEDFDVNVDASGPSADFGHLIVNPFTGSYTATATSDQSDTYGSFLISFAAAAGGVAWYPAPAANDGDTATSAFSDSTPECLRVALAVERLIYTIELDVGQETAGVTAYELYGTDDATFTTKALLATLSFTATGSFTLDTVTASWVPTASYLYYQLEHVSGGGSDREFYEVRLFSAVSTGGGVTSHPLLSGRDTSDQHPASAVTVADSAGWFADDTVETTLAELAAKTIGYQAHGNLSTTETFDAATGQHSGTLNANCTFTLTAAASGTASWLFLELIQDGTGGWTITLPASVVNKTDIEGDQDTTASETTFLALYSRDGGTTWYGGWWGGAATGGGGVDVEDEGTPLSTTATTLDFTGAGVTASGSGATKTINIPGGSGSGAKLDYVQKTTGTSITATTEATANTVVTGSAVAYDGSTVVMIEFFAGSIDPQNTVASFMQFWLYDGSSSIGYLGIVRTPSTSEMYVPVHLMRRLTPSAATHTYSIRATTNTGTGLVDAGAGGAGNLAPAFIRITQS